MDKLHVVLALAGVLVVCLALFSSIIKETPLSEQMVALLFGILVGPAALDWIDPATWGRTEQVVVTATRVTLAIGLMGVALRIEHDQLRRILRPVVVLLTLGMVGMWLMSSLAVSVWLQVGLWTALMIGAIVTPTDPIAASTIVTGPVAQELLPGYVRQSLSLESGSNDGLAFLIVMLGVMGVHHHGTTVFTEWLFEALMLGVLLAVVIGIAMGRAAAAALRWAKRRRTIERYSLLSYTTALSLGTLGVAKICGTDALIAVFVAGLTFNLSSDVEQQHEEENIQETVNKLFTIPIFVLLGALLPWREWVQLGWPLVGIVIGVLLLRRLPVFLVLSPILRRNLLWRDLAYLGWFGPIGIAALFYAATAWDKTGDSLPWHVATAVVAASILAHGMTAAPLAYLYARRAGDDRPKQRVTARRKREA